MGKRHEQIVHRKFITTVAKIIWEKFNFIKKLIKFLKHAHYLAKLISMCNVGEGGGKMSIFKHCYRTIWW